mmetsp:Transcript_1693/g.5904  ORF Transcript_1693/g.5904 Transcript_1693/m.5904 type:complete len:204 (+) Transcript_1693:1305-1916(+)
MKDVSQTSAFPSRQYVRCVPASIQHLSPSGTFRPRCAVWMKLVLSVWGAIPVPASCRAKNASTLGALTSSSSCFVLANRSELVSSHMPRSCSTSVRQLGPYEPASDLAGGAHTLTPLRSSLSLPAMATASNSSWTTPAFFSSAASHSYPLPCTSGKGTAVRPSMYEFARCSPSSGHSLTNSSSLCMRRKLSSTRATPGASFPN